MRDAFDTKNFQQGTGVSYADEVSQIDSIFFCSARNSTTLPVCFLLDRLTIQKDSK